MAQIWSLAQDGPYAMGVAKKKVKKKKKKNASKTNYAGIYNSQLWEFSSVLVVRSQHFHGYGPGSVPGQGTEIPHQAAACCSQKKKEKKKPALLYFWFVTLFFLCDLKGKCIKQ